ncbi:glycine oxidase ThiO [Rhodovibrio sodomensis]|uniref:Glycine oxidase ThiO n=1 Tax=Rhodovibrio sodomensis TaxID=1088 RepID=A0ABS1DAM9_9PROT|nr:glycine oxidase ThiO [Rhodovibrio sodomensis]MBK1667172.1 glycine oxidase ThiO [Rhodovibrio sodomensis]
MTSLLDDISIHQRPRTAIVGAGVNGLCIAWQLARHGCAVDVYERGRIGRGASWAAAGMLAPGAEAEPGEHAVTAAGQQALALWPAFARDLQQASGIDPELRTDGLMIAATNRDEAEQLRHDHSFLQQQGVPAEWLSGAQAREREPYLRAGLPGALFSPNDGQANNRQLVQGLAAAARAAGVRIHEDTRVDALDTAQGRATGLVVEGARVAADAVVLCAGAWGREIDGVPTAAQAPIRPIKGQMLALRMDPGQPLLRRVLWAPKVYLVPRRDGQLLIGATVEEQGFDDSMTAGGVFALLEAAWRAIPAIEELPIAEMWAGHRPGSRDDAPVLGATPVDGLYLANGHHRNGILMTPLTGQAVAAEILTGRRHDSLAPFRVERFHDPAHARGQAARGLAARGAA